jgi:hypothetical protein
MKTSIGKGNVLRQDQEKPCENPEPKEPPQQKISNKPQKQQKKRSLNDLLKNVGDCV